VLQVLQVVYLKSELVEQKVQHLVVLVVLVVDQELLVQREW
jgi:hypothetical protein